MASGYLWEYLRILNYVHMCVGLLHLSTVPVEARRHPTSASWSYRQLRGATLDVGSKPGSSAGAVGPPNHGPPLYPVSEILSH